MLKEKRGVGSRMEGYSFSQREQGKDWGGIREGGSGESQGNFIGGGEGVRAGRVAYWYAGGVDEKKKPEDGKGLKRHNWGEVQAGERRRKEPPQPLLQAGGLGEDMSVLWEYICVGEGKDKSRVDEERNPSGEPSTGKGLEGIE